MCTQKETACLKILSVQICSYVLRNIQYIVINDTANNMQRSPFEFSSVLIYVRRDFPVTNENKIDLKWSRLCSAESHRIIPHYVTSHIQTRRNQIAAASSLVFMRWIAEHMLRCVSYKSQKKRCSSVICNKKRQQLPTHPVQLNQNRKDRNSASVKAAPSNLCLCYSEFKVSIFILLFVCLCKFKTFLHLPNFFYFTELYFVQQAENATLVIILQSGYAT